MLFRGQFDWFWEIHFHPQICRFLGAGTFLTNLRLFVKKNFQRSRRAHGDFTKNTKFWKILEIICKCINLSYFKHFCGDFENSTFLLRSVDLLELELFWQVSDFLSRNFFCDLAEPNVIIPKTRKSEKCLEIIHKCV